MEQSQPGGGSYTQLHLTTSPLLGLMNNPNYTALLGFAQGNLAEASTFSQVSSTSLCCKSPCMQCHAIMDGAYALITMFAQRMAK